MTLTTEELRCTGNARRLEFEMKVSAAELSRVFCVYYLDSRQGKLLTVSPESMMDRGEVTILESYDSLEAASDSEFLQCFLFLVQLAQSVRERMS